MCSQGSGCWVSQTAYTPHRLVLGKDSLKSWLGEQGGLLHKTKCSSLEEDLLHCSSTADPDK